MADDDDLIAPVCRGVARCLDDRRSPAHGACDVIEDDDNDDACDVTCRGAGRCKSSSATMLLWVFFASTILNCVSGADDKATTPPVRLPDRLFNESTSLFNRTVTCLPRPDGDYVFVSETWSCYDLRVDGLRVRTCHPSLFGADAHCNDTDGQNDIGAICRFLLKSHGVPHQLKAAMFVSDEPCQSPEPAERYLRAILRPDGEAFRWDIYHSALSGCVKTLRCMLADD